MKKLKEVAKDNVMNLEEKALARIEKANFVDPDKLVVTKVSQNLTRKFAKKLQIIDDVENPTIGDELIMGMIAFAFSNPDRAYPVKTLLETLRANKILIRKLKDKLDLDLTKTV